ncbi:MAG: serine/threonine protein kinase [Caldisericum sp.]|nr:serine/threonine protein kinase [Caldisericum sp.]
MPDNVKKIDKYEIIEEIGRGGMAIVYKGLHPFLEEYVAIKVLPEYFVQDREFVERFTREAKTMIALQHPHIVRIYDAGIYENKYFIVMDYIRGRTIKELISDKKDKLLDVDKIIDIVMQVADALSYAHKHNIIHRDVKPSNILYDESRESAYITDFGIAKAVSGTKLTQTGVSLGTPEYMSPEQFSETSDVDQRTDIYSLGIVFYEMLTGDIPFKGDTPLGVAYKHVHSYPTRPRIKNPKISVYLEKIILKMLAKDPNDRYQSMDEVIQDLKLFKDKDYEHMIASSYVEEKKCKLTVRSEPEGAEIYLDGEYIGVTPLEDTEVSFGKHKILLVSPGYKVKTDDLEIPLTKKAHEVFFKLQPELGLKKEKVNEKGLSEEDTVAIPKVDVKEEIPHEEQREEITSSEEKTVKMTKENKSEELSNAESPKISVKPEEKETIPIGSRSKNKVSSLKPLIAVLSIIMLLVLGFFIIKGNNRQSTTNTNNITPQLAYLSISSEPQGAEVYIDGVKVGITPLNEFSTKPGTHTIKLTKEGYLDSNATIDIKEKESKTLSYTLKEKTSTTTAEKDIPVSISSNPAGAKVYIDGKEIGATPIANYSMKAGTYTLKLIKDGYKEFSQTLTLSS